MQDQAQLRRWLSDLTRKSLKRQKTAIASLLPDVRDVADEIQSEARIEGGHGEWPRGSDIWCSSCGKLENINSAVAWAWHPASYEI
jgi:hypothetical protein